MFEVECNNCRKNKKMKMIRHGKYIRVEVSKYGTTSNVIDQIKRHIDDCECITECWDSVTYVVDGIEYQYRAEAIISQIKFEENFKDECNCIFNSKLYFNNYEIGCSRIENDTLNEGTDRTYHSNLTVYEIVDILTRQPYIHRFSANIDKELQGAFIKLSEEIIKAKKINNSIFNCEME